MKNNFVKVIIAIVVIGVLVGFNMLMTSNTKVKETEHEADEHSHGATNKILDATLEMGKVCVIETDKGTFEFVLLEKDIPNNTKAIKKLIGKKAYNNVKFVEVKDWCIKTDFATCDMKPLDNEAAYGISSCRGAIVLAKGNKSMKNVSAFSVIKETSPSMAEYFTVIGYVIKGMDVIDKIEANDTIKSTSFRKATDADEKVLVDTIKQGTKDSEEVGKVEAIAQQKASQMGMSQ